MCNNNGRKIESLGSRMAMVRMVIKIQIQIVSLSQVIKIKIQIQIVKVRPILRITLTVKSPSQVFSNSGKTILRVHLLREQVRREQVQRREQVHRIKMKI